MSAPQRGRLIALEGIDGCGKSTQASRLAESLGAVLTFEPGATALGRSLRSLLLDPERTAPAVRAEALLMAADRAQHVEEVIGPAIESGQWVVTDRYSASTLAYQGWGRGLATEPLRDVINWAAGGIDADLSVLVDVPPDVARRRLAGCRPDRLEALDPAFHERVRHGYIALVRSETGRWAVVDGTGPIEAVAKTVESAVTERLGRP